MKKLLIILLLIVGCVPFTFSDIQNAKIVDKGKFEFTPSYSLSHNTEYFGVQIAYGLNEKLNFRSRLERIMMINKFENDPSSIIDLSILNSLANSTHLSFGLKYQLTKNKSAFYFPISFTKFDISNEIVAQIEPTYLRTFSLSNNLEFNPSIKALIPIQSNAKGFMLALNLGLGISPNFTKWVIRSEAGYLLYSGGIYNMSIGLSIYP